MTTQAASTSTLQQLLEARNGLIIHQALCAAAKLGVADLLERGVCTTAELAGELKVNEDALYRLLRALASQGVFEETAPRTFRNLGLSCSLRTDEPGSIRPAFLFWGTDFYYRSFGEILYSVQTGKPTGGKLFGMNEWEYMRQNPDLATIFDDAMTNFSSMQPLPLPPPTTSELGRASWMWVAATESCFLMSSRLTRDCAGFSQTSLTCWNARDSVGSSMVNWRRALQCNRAIFSVKYPAAVGPTL
jgi:hypothetical protein